MNYDTQALRAETVSFTLPLQELRSWRQGLKADAGPVCAPKGGELRGDLGLKEWVDSALYPVASADLRAGLHPLAPEPPSPPPPVRRPPVEPGAAQAFPAAEARRQIEAAARGAALAYGQAVQQRAVIAAALSNAQAAMQTTVAPMLPVLTNEARRVLSGNLATLSAMDAHAEDDVSRARKTLADLRAAEREAAEQQRRESGEVSASLVARAREEAEATRIYARDAKLKAEKAKRIADGIVSFRPNSPLDGLLHLVEFVIAYGGNITPTWTFLIWKGPAALPGVSGQAARTNSLNIALGPSAEQSRLIANQLITNAARP